MLQDHPLAKVWEPFEDETEWCMDAIGEKHALLPKEGALGVADGLKVPLQMAGTCPVQNKCCNGWTGGTHVDSVFLSAPDGLIRCCTIDATRSMHNSSLADFGAHEKMSEMCKKHNVKVVHLMMSA